MATITNKDVVGFFTGIGYSPQAAAAIAGHLSQESKLSTTALGDKGTAFGLGQWRGDRLASLKDYAKSKGQDYKDAKTQLGFVDHEMKTGKDAGAKRAHDGLKSAKTVEEATAAFMHYERPLGYTVAAPQKGHAYSSRLANAKSAMAVAPVAAPKGGGLLAVADVTKNAPKSSVGSLAVEYSMGPNRPNKPSQDIVGVIANSVQAVLGPDAKVSITSGTEDAGKQYGSNRHKTGLAADFAVYDAKGKQVTAVNAPETMAAIAKETAKRGALGIGWGTDYMNGAHMHVDKVAPTKGQANTWGNLGKANRDQLVGIMEEAKAGKYAALDQKPASFDPGGLIAPKPGGLLVSAAVAAPVKASAKDIAAAGYQQAANSMKSGGVKGVGGGLLSSAPSPADPAIGASATGKANIGVTSPGVGQKAVIGATGIMTSQQPSAIGTATVNLGKQAAPAVAMPTQAPISMPTAPISKPAAPITMPVAAPIAAPIAAPLAKAVQQAAPVSRTAPVQAVQQQAPAQSFGPPMGTALGVWNGTAPVGIANNGSVLSAHNGNVYSYSPTYDRTTISTHAGDVIGSFKGKQQDTSGLLGDTQTKAGGLLSGAMGKLGGMFDGKGSQFGDKARSAAGTIAGGLLGSYVAGPVGSAIGAALGRELAKGNNPLNGGLKGILSAATGHGSFPSAPAAPSQTANFGNGGVAGGQATWGGLSQTAKDAVSAGKGGLY